jgi:hypothetical protein
MMSLADEPLTPEAITALDHTQARALLDQQLDFRNRIFALEEILAAQPEAMHGDDPRCPLTHSFADGIYMREIKIPAGTVLTGKIHRHAHPNVLLEGEVLVVTEQRGVERLQAPFAMISEPGTKRAVVALSDVRWLTFHSVGDERDLAKIEKMVIAPDYVTLARDSRKELVA